MSVSVTVKSTFWPRRMQGTLTFTWYLQSSSSDSSPVWGLTASPRPPSGVAQCVSGAVAGSNPPHVPPSSAGPPAEPSGLPDAPEPAAPDDPAAPPEPVEAELDEVVLEPPEPVVATLDVDEPTAASSPEHAPNEANAASEKTSGAEPFAHRANDIAGRYTSDPDLRTRQFVAGERAIGALAVRTPPRQSCSMRWDRARALSCALLGLAQATCSNSPGPAGAGGSDGVPSDASVTDRDLAACVADGPISIPRPHCPSDFPDNPDCGPGSPDYTAVAPIFAARCTICHHAGGLETKFRFDSYALIHQNMTTRSDIVSQVYSCRMPPSCAPNLSPEERQTMVLWFACNEPDAPDAGGDDAGDEAGD
jgi:hypothetical protein